MSDKIDIKGLHAWFGDKEVLKGVSMSIKANAITAVIGPSGCGKTTLIRCINRMHEITPNARVQGSVLLDDIDVYEQNPVEIRTKIGMVFRGRILSRP